MSLCEVVSDTSNTVQGFAGDFSIDSETVANDDFRMEGLKGSIFIVEYCGLIFSRELGLLRTRNSSAKAEISTRASRYRSRPPCWAARRR